MQIIPVIDLFNGLVVHAKQGNRHHYQPIQSKLVESSEPIAIVAALLNLHPFEQLYIADLNAIQKLEGTSPNNYEVIQQIQLEFPQIRLWVDAGIRDNQSLTIWQPLNVRLVIGSEGFTSIDTYLTLNPQEKNFILSLDFMPNGYIGPAELLLDQTLWPEDVIIMSLTNVGTNQGINTELIDRVKTNNKRHRHFAAGGVRNYSDLLQLKEANIQGALIATALHMKQISAQEILALER